MILIHFGRTALYMVSLLYSHTQASLLLYSHKITCTNSGCFTLHQWTTWTTLCRSLDWSGNADNTGQDIFSSEWVLGLKVSGTLGRIAGCMSE